MAVDLTWGSVVVADTSEGDVYRQQGPEQKGALNTREIVFPYTAGRELQVVGKYQTDATSWAMTFDVFAFRTSEANLNVLASALAAAVADEDTPLATLGFALPNDASQQTVTNCLMSLSISTSRVKRTAAGLYMMRFVAGFSQFYGG